MRHSVQLMDGAFRLNFAAVSRSLNERSDQFVVGRGTVMMHEGPAAAAVERSLRVIKAREKVVKAWVKWDSGRSRRAAEWVDDEVVRPMRGLPRVWLSP